MTQRSDEEDHGWRAHAAPVLLLVLLPLLASILLITGMFDNNPALFFSFLGVHVRGALLPGAPGWLDPTIALITQPLGRLSAEDWLRGIIPWWNPYTGPGMPLAAEMQTLSFFLPFVLLLKFWQGWLWLKIILQIMSGLAMYALLIELGCRRIAALVPGVLYALNGTFFLVPHAMGPIPFLPLLLLGVERAGRAARMGRPLGWGLIPLALAYSLYAGYPEIAFLDGLLVACWTIWRFAALADVRWAFAGKVAAGGIIGVMLSLPLIVPFLQYVQLSILGAHQFLFSIMRLGASIAPVQLLPLTYGPQGTSSSVYIDWAELGFWFGLPPVVLALAALARPGDRRGLILLLAGFVLFWQARIWGFPPAIWIANLIPEVGRTDAVRFIGVAMEAALFILAGLGIDGWLKVALPGRIVRNILIITTLLVLASLLAAAPEMLAWYRDRPGLLPFSLIADAAEIIAALLMLALLARPSGRLGRFVLPGIVCADAFLIAFLPQLSAPRGGHLDLAGVSFLGRHQGLARNYTLQPFGPDYPAGYKVASINDNALPVTRSWRDYIRAQLDPHGDVVMFTGAQPRLRPGLPDQAEELRLHLPAYGRTGVKYVLTKPGDDPFRRKVRLPVGRSPRALALGPGQSVSGTIPPGIIRLPEIRLVGILVGTYAGAARGILNLSICAGTDCAEGHADLGHAADDEYLPVRLDHPLVLPRGTSIRYRLSHQAGSAVALWLGRLDPSAPSSLAVSAGFGLPLEFAGPRLAPDVRRVFTDEAMNIYRLPHYRRFFTATPGCSLAPRGWNRVIADCLHPAALTRLEARFPGWHVLINGRAVRIGRAGRIFQSVPLPVGRSDVEFFYRPPGTRLATAAACLALLSWIGLMARGMLLNGQLHRHP
ncbi:MAG TPA: hypothetical protein VFN77_06490 [Acetobacteraceae bacterium]|nr:hypothetical protein [Acetobacteraceae bacterium]